MVRGSMIQTRLCVYSYCYHSYGRCLGDLPHSHGHDNATVKTTDGDNITQSHRERANKLASVELGVRDFFTVYKEHGDTKTPVE